MSNPQNKPKRGAGRPTLYNEEMQEKADRYIHEYKNLDEVVPSVAGLCVFLKVRRSTVYGWEKVHPRIAETLDDIRQLQEKVLLNLGLRGDFNPTITKLALANHGYFDKQELDHTTNGSSINTASTIQYTIVDARKEEDGDS